MTSLSDQRFKLAQAEYAAWAGIFGNALLTTIKGGVGYLSGSKALIADSAHSASEVAGSIAALVGIRSAKLHADDQHPYDRGRTESITAIIVSVLLLIAGIEIGLSSLKKIAGGVDEPPQWNALITIVVALAVQEAIFRYNFRQGNKLSRPAWAANAAEHRSGVFASGIALIGIGGAILGNVFDTPQLYYLDPIAGVFISAMVLRKGFKLVVESIHNTMDRVLHEEDAEELLETIQRVKGVIAVDDLRAREHGHYVIVDVKISVNPRITVTEGHDIAKSVKLHLMKRFHHVSDVFIHVHPYDPGYPYKRNIDLDQDDFPTLLH